jgi:ADP-ribose pyrophosphatase
MTSSSSDSRIAWQGRSWRLLVQSSQSLDGSIVERGMVEHPGAVVLVPVRKTEKGFEVLMLYQYRRVLDRSILELPAGTREGQEPWLACAQRELQEETGYRADHFQELGRCWPAPGMSNEVMSIYLATGLHPDPLPQDSDEIIEVRHFLLQTLVEMALNGQIHDAKSVVGILRTAHFLQGNSFTLGQFSG